MNQREFRCYLRCPFPLIYMILVNMLEIVKESIQRNSLKINKSDPHTYGRELQIIFFFF